MDPGALTGAEGVVEAVAILGRTEGDVRKHAFVFFNHVGHKAKMACLATEAKARVFFCFTNFFSKLGLEDKIKKKINSFVPFSNFK